VVMLGSYRLTSGLQACMLGSHGWYTSGAPEKTQMQTSSKAKKKRSNLPSKFKDLFGKWDIEYTWKIIHFNKTGILALKQHFHSNAFKNLAK